MSNGGLDFADLRWATFLGGYKVPYDPRPALKALAEGPDVDAAWHELWENLHHQGDIGAASFAAIPHLVRLLADGRADAWNACTLALVIELARDHPANPSIPEYLEADYAAAWHRLAELALQQFGAANDESLVNSIIAVLAIVRGQRTLAWIALNLLEDERREFLIGSGLV